MLVIVLVVIAIAWYVTLLRRRKIENIVSKMLSDIASHQKIVVSTRELLQRMFEGEVKYLPELHCERLKGLMENELREIDQFFAKNKVQVEKMGTKTSLRAAAELSSEFYAMFREQISNKISKFTTDVNSLVISLHGASLLTSVVLRFDEQKTAVEMFIKRLEGSRHDRSIGANQFIDAQVGQYSDAVVKLTALRQEFVDNWNPLSHRYTPPNDAWFNNLQNVAMEIWLTGQSLGELANG